MNDNEDLPAPKDMLGIIIFDLDGTLVNSMPTHAQAYGEVLSAFSIPEQASQRDYYFTAGQPLGQQFEHTLSLLGCAFSEADIQELSHQFLEILRRSQFELFPATAAVVAQLSRAGYVLAISSGSSPDNVAAKLRHASIDGYFSVILGSDYEHGVLLKGAEHFEQIKKRLGVADAYFIENTLAVGDGPHDMEIARDAGLRAVGIARNHNERELRQAGANNLIDDLDGLLDILAPDINHATFIPIAQLPR
jgi:phosphoglycolate phosphatase